ncbi:glycosyltransferase family 4 protein [Rothia nasisuis]|uniref:glycosyltransferase family 4 protein n=1 Tax=Rothia nasisuis TaxID=2109647 RepID=UPI001F30E477|nr:glycosyltransferase family 4 protein [Rothia nasisuis]
MKIGVLSSWNMNDPAAWSGVVMPAVQALRERADIVPLPVPHTNDAAIDRLLTRLYGRSGTVYLPGDALATTYRKSRQVRTMIKDHRVDAVISLAASKESLGVPSNIPLVQVTDSSFSAVIEGYFNTKKISRLSLHQGRLLDRLVAKKSAHYCVASEWSAQKLMEDANLPPHRITVAPFGPGISPAAHAQGSRTTGSSGLAILFIGSNWERKGGDRALEIFSRARALRPDLTMTVVGAPGTEAPAGVTYRPKMPRADLSELYLSHDLLLEPTHASAGGVVVTDALNHGLPVISTKVGGIPTLVRDGYTGWLVEERNTIQEATQLLTRLSREEIEVASVQARKDAETRLTWAVWADAVITVCKNTVRR